MHSIPGRALISDFDGTIARLPVAWSSLRKALGVRKIRDLWTQGLVDAWAEITVAEMEAAAIAQPVSAVVDHLLRLSGFAILTNNSEKSVQAFLDRFDELKTRTVHVAGRESLQGPKTDFRVFARGYRICSAALRLAHEDTSVAYLADQRYELEFARRLGATPIDVAELIGL